MDIEKRREIGRLGGLKHSREHMRTIGARGGEVTTERMHDEAFRNEHIRRSRMGKEFGFPKSSLPMPEVDE